MPKQLILIMTDTQRLDMVSCYQDIGLKTPHIDSLAAEGVRFTKAYTVQPVCGPARSALFTGQFPCVNGVFANGLALGQNVKTIGQRLHDKGVRTGYIGKWHLDGGDYFGLGTAAEGWEPSAWYDMRNYLEELSGEERVLSRREHAQVKAEFTFAYRCARRAVQFLQAHRDEDFLLVVSFDEPHDPSLCPEPFASMYQDFELPKRPNVLDILENKPAHEQAWAGERRFTDRERCGMNRASFFGCNAFVDQQTGYVLSAAKALLPQPCIIYTTDHGEMLESHCLNGKGPVAYEEACHVPLILYGFGRGTVHTPVSHIDLSPTVWDFFGFDKPPAMQGDSLLPLLDGSGGERRDVFMEYGRYETDHDGFGGFSPMRCIYDGRYKLAIHLLSQDECYDLDQDPYEMDNRISDPALAGVRAGLLERLLAHMNQVRDPFRGWYWEARPWNGRAGAQTWEYTGYTRQRQELDYEPPQLDYDTGLTAAPLTRRKERR